MTNLVDLTPLVQTLISVAVAIISGFVIPWIRAKAGEARASNLMKWACIGVQAAEQVYKNKGQSGKDKYAYVEQFLYNHGFRLNTNEVEQAIEAAVYQLGGIIIPDTTWTNKSEFMPHQETTDGNETTYN